MRRASHVLAVILTLTLTHRSLAWDSPGHMIVAGIAYDQLSPTDQKKLATAIKSIKDFSLITDGLGTPTPADRDLVMAAAVWPDLIKSGSPSFFRNDNKETEPLNAIDQNAGKRADGKLPSHPSWHFIDIPYHFDTKKDAPMTSTDVTAVDVLNVLDQQLRQPPVDDSQRAYELAFLLHLVGDIHQPLHAILGMDKKHHKGDKGGGLIKLQDPITHSSSLHIFWDDLLGKSAGQDRLDDDVATANQQILQIPKAALPADEDDAKNPPDFLAWAKASHELAKADGYNPLTITPIVPSHHVAGSSHTPPIGNATITAKYHDDAVNDANTQVSLAGQRLAALLNIYLKQIP